MAFCQYCQFRCAPQEFDQFQRGNTVTGKWEKFGDLLVRIAGKDIAKVEAGIKTGLAISATARTGPKQSAAASNRPQRSKKESADVRQ
jgi:hypothetical protein